MPNPTLAVLTATAMLFTRMKKHYAANRILEMITTLQGSK
jgi:hypothetical protein